MSTIDGPQNPNFSTDLIPIEDPKSLLSIKNEGRINRPLATQDHIGKTAFSAYLGLVQYGTYKKSPACLIAIDFSFRFPNKGNGRFSSAEIELTFEHAMDPATPSVRCEDASLDPIVANFAPKTLLGQIRTREHTKTQETEVPVVFGMPFFDGAKVGLTNRFSNSTTTTEEGCSEIHGNLAQDDEHDEGANSVTWDMTENPIRKDGILRSFRGVVVLKVRKGEAFWLRVGVKPVVKFSIDPKTWFMRRMRQDRDEPVLLDGKTGFGDEGGLGGNEFDGKNFPWEDVLRLPPTLGVQPNTS